MYLQDKMMCRKRGSEADKSSYEVQDVSHSPTAVRCVSGVWCFEAVVLS